MEHDKLLDSITDKATKIAEEFTEKSFPTIWGIGMGGIITIPMNKKTIAKWTASAIIDAIMNLTGDD